MLILFSCRKPYSPLVISSNQSYLVVDGMINSGNDSTFIYLRRTVKLNSALHDDAEQGARITIESDKNDIYTLQETAAGQYLVTGLNLPTDRDYRLHIFTANNKEYVSDFVENKITPPIDSVYAVPLVSGVQFSVSTHDNTNKTRYYRWDATESWKYDVSGEHPSKLIYKDGNILPRSPDSLINICYKIPQLSSAIFIGNSSKLSQDVIEKAPLGYVDATTKKLQSTYMLLVRQYALTADAYKYWKLLQTSSQHLGGITDPQPTSAITNLHCITNPAEPVIGYVSVSTITRKRVFLMGRTLPFKVFYPEIPDTVSCGGGTIFINPVSSFPYRLRQTFASGDTLLIAAVTDSGKNIGYNYMSSLCADCRLRGGTIERPPYWPPGF
ncbi:MAG: DUF4249 domain-containing protein [Bacteroidetes bacterium]|nr:DUF4249 domain-containing protein [Bacteroidota bacterium]